jgi:hypothetical protein
VYYVGDGVPIWNGSKFIARPVPADLALPLDANLAHAQAHEAQKGFDLWATWDSGTLVIGSGLAWADQSTRASAITQIDGIWVNTSAIVLRAGTGSGDLIAVPAGQASQLGTFYTAAGVAEASDSEKRRLLYNTYNREERSIFVTEAANSSWAYYGDWRVARGNSGNAVELMFGHPGIPVSASANVIWINDPTFGAQGYAGIAVDSTSVNSARQVDYLPLVAGSARCDYQGVPGVGHHVLRWLEKGGGLSGINQTFYGPGADSKPGLIGRVWL